MHGGKTWMMRREGRNKERRERKWKDRNREGKKVSKIDRDREQIKARNKVIEYIMLLERALYIT